MKQTATAEFESLLDVLTTRQHLSPHEPIGQSLEHVVGAVGVCAVAVKQAMTWLGLEPDKSIGRLRRTELLQLARTVHRIWRQQPTDVASAATRGQS